MDCGYVLFLHPTILSNLYWSTTCIDMYANTMQHTLVIMPSIAIIIIGLTVYEKVYSETCLETTAMRDRLS